MLIDTIHTLDTGALDAGAVKFDFETGFPFVSGIQAPIYIDTRKLFFDPIIRERTISALEAHIEKLKLEFDVVAGVESGAIAPAALLASVLKKRFVYIKKKPKDHGLKRMIECGDVAGSKVLLVEDLVSTGLSSLNAVQVVREAGGTISDCVSIHLYDFPETSDNFSKVSISLHPLALVSDIGREAVKRDIISNDQGERIIAWLQKPHEHW
ncbi:MAG: orotate phosphoribosyltransferase [bacterium]|nr:orotate phosphoribosyltransferase [bacterium]